MTRDSFTMQTTTETQIQKVSVKHMKQQKTQITKPKKNFLKNTWWFFTKPDYQLFKRLFKGHRGLPGVLTHTHFPSKKSFKNH